MVPTRALELGVQPLLPTLHLMNLIEEEVVRSLPWHPRVRELENAFEELERQIARAPRVLEIHERAVFGRQVTAGHELCEER